MCEEPCKYDAPCEYCTKGNNDKRKEDEETHL